MQKYKIKKSQGGANNKSGGVIGKNKKAKVAKKPRSHFIPVLGFLLRALQFKPVTLICLHKNKNS